MGPVHTFTVSIPGGAVDIILFTNAAAAFHASAHTHSGHEFHYIHNGCGSLRMGTQTHLLSPGSCYLVPKEAFHHVEMVSAEICRLTALIIPQNGSRLKEITTFVEFQPDRQMQMILELLLGALSNMPDAAAFESYLSSGLTMLLIRLLEVLVPVKAAAVPQLPVRSEEAMKQEILSYIASDLGNASLTGLSVQLHLSTRQTARFLQEKMGEHFSVLLRKHRIEKAKALMISGKVGLEEIAFLCGYQSYKGFHTAFCKHTGISPKVYKDSLS